MIKTYKRKLRRVYPNDDGEEFFVVSVPKKVAATMHTDHVEWIVDGDDIKLIKA